MNEISLYEAFCLYYEKDLADKIECHEVIVNGIILIPGFLKKWLYNLNIKPLAEKIRKITEDRNFQV
jgi:hypothetical protein